MIRLLANTDINREKWDACIAASPSCRIYALSWYLDAVAPGWNGLADEHHQFVMPLPERKKYGLPYVFQPLYAQQLGVFARHGNEPEVLPDCLAELQKRYRYIHTQLNASNTPVAAFPAFSFTPRSNYELKLNANADKLKEAFHGNTIRNLKKSQELRIITSGVPLKELMLLKAANDKVKKKPAHYDRLFRILSLIYEKDSGFAAGAYSGDSLIAAAFIAHFNKRLYYLIPVSSARGMEKGAMTGILSELIGHYAGTDSVLDFEGSDIPGIARFFEGFGAERTRYTSLKMNRLPLPFKWLKK